MYSLLLLLALLFFPDEALRGAGTGLDICLGTVVPSLLPFMLLSSMAVGSGWGLRLGRLFSPLLRPLLGLGPAASMCFVTGLIGGYPCGALTVAKAVDSGLMQKADGERALAFCNNSGPLFIIGTAGAAVYKSTRVGWLLYLCHVIGAAAAAIIFGRRLREGRAASAAKSPPAGVLAGNAAKEGGAAIVSVCALIITFSALIEALRLSRFPLFVGLVEVSRGINALGPFGRRALPLAAAYLSWGGLSVHLQTEAVTGGLSKRCYYPGKIISSLVSAAACITLMALHIL